MSDTSIVLDVPELGNESLRLRPWRVEDAAELVQAWNDPTVMAGSEPPPDTSLAAAQRWIEGCEERRRSGVAVDLVIAGPHDEVLGEVGLSGFDLRRRAALIGWWVGADHRGRGVGTDAVSLFTDWSLGAGRLWALMAEIEADNHASIRVAERAGYAAIDVSRIPQGSARGRAPRVWYVAHSTVK